MSNREVTIVKLRVMALLGLAGVTVLALARADAAGGVSCREPRPNHTPGVTVKTGTDGSSCDATSEGGPALARASGSSSEAKSTTDVRGKATSNATSGGNAEADEQDGGTAKATANSGIASAEAIGDHPGGSTGNDHTNATATASKSGEAFARSVLQGSATAKSDSGASNAQDSGGGLAKSTTFRNGTSQAFTRDECVATAGASDIARVNSSARSPVPAITGEYPRMRRMSVIVLSICASSSTTRMLSESASEDFIQDFQERVRRKRLVQARVNQPGRER